MSTQTVSPREIPTPLGALEVPGDPFTWYVDTVAMRESQARSLRSLFELNSREAGYLAAEERWGTEYMLGLLAV